ncbi:GNAT family N-acetyltransferase [Streptomyces caeni]|uniref:GNAT family N-acetyltransferase n=1 Tax=Streptomyces caeni TaxID=2307231 RepID=A0ABW4ILV9_9ACTN
MGFHDAGPQRALAQGCDPAHDIRDSFQAVLNALESARADLQAMDGLQDAGSPAPGPEGMVPAAPRGAPPPVADPPRTGGAARALLDAVVEPLWSRGGRQGPGGRPEPFAPPRPFAPPQPFAPPEPFVPPQPFTPPHAFTPPEPSAPPHPFAPPLAAGPATAESKPLLLTHAFEDLGRGRVQLKADHRNQCSQAAVAGLGAHREGVPRRHRRRPDGTRRDTVHFLLLAHEWPVAKEHLAARP